MSSPSPSDPQPSHDRPTGLGRLARQISRRTTDLLAIAIVLVTGLSVGGTLVEWWRTDPHDVSSLPPVDAAPWWDDEGAVVLEFGEHAQAVERQTVWGDVEQAVAVLVDRCRRIAAAGGPPGRPFDSEEEALLEAVDRAGLPPVAEGGGWQIHRFDWPLPTVVGTRRFAESDGPTIANRPRRVVCWGTALPGADDSWTLFTTHSSAERGPASAGRTLLSDVPMPPGGRRVLTLRGRAGGGLTAFAGEGGLDDWTGCFDEWFQGRGWAASRPWAAAAAVRSAGFTGPSGEQIDVQISETDTGLTGLLTLTAGRQTAESGR